MKLLLGVPAPRDNVDRVVDCHKRLTKCDIYKACFYTEVAAYREIRKFFLDHKEYTHLAILADDCTIEDDQVQRIIDDIKQYDYSVMSAICNVNKDDFMFYAITPLDNVPSPDWNRRVFNYYDKVELQHEENIFQVGFVGFSFTVIRRDIVEQYEFMGDHVSLKVPYEEGKSLDVMFCAWCHVTGIPIFVDKRAKLVHLRGYTGIRVGIEKPRCEFIKKEQ